MLSIKQHKVQNVSFILTFVVSILIASLIGLQLKLTQLLWILLASFFCLRPALQLSLRQIVHRVVVILLGIAVSSGLLRLEDMFVASSIVYILAVGCAYLYVINQPSSNLNLNLLLIFITTVTLSFLFPDSTTQAIQDRCLYVILGGIVSFLLSLLFLRVNYTASFKIELLSMLECLTKCTEDLGNNLAEKTNINTQTSSVTQLLLKNQSHSYPEWIYASGFNPGLRSGMRFFLIHVDRLTEILYSLDGLLMQKIDDDFWSTLQTSLSNAMAKNRDLLRVLMDYLKDAKPEQTEESYIDDIKALEDELYTVIPKELELVDINPAYLTLAAIVREVKDMRNNLLQLVLILQKATPI